MDARRDYQRGRILAALEDGPLSALELAQRLHLTKDGVLRHLASMQQAPRMIRIAAYRNTGGRPTPLYGAGEREDAPYISTRVPKGRVTSEQQQARILKLLKKEPLSAAALSDRINLRRVGIHITRLRKAKRIYVLRWQPTTAGYPSPVYAVGDQPDAPRPPTMSEKEKRARAWAKLKADPARHDLYRRLVRLRRNPQHPFSALGL